MSLTKSDCEALGCPPQEVPFFRQYCRDNSPVPDLSAIPEGARYAHAVTLFADWKAIRLKQLEEAKAANAIDMREQMERNAEVGEADRAYAEAQDRAQHPEVRADSVLPDPAELGAVPDNLIKRPGDEETTPEGATLPPRRRRKRSRQRR